MMIVQRIRFPRRHLSRQMIVAAYLVLFLIISPARSFSQCEPNGTAINTTISLIAQQDNAISAMAFWTALTWGVTLDSLRAQMGSLNRQPLMDKMNWFWAQWGGAYDPNTQKRGAWQGVAAQLSAGTLDQSRQLGSFNDTSNVQAAALDEQQQRVKSKFLYQPTDQACRFDTTARYMTPVRSTSEALENGYEWDFVQLGINEKNSIAQYGPADLQRKLWDNYTKIFCDYQAENGSPANNNAGCTADLPDKDIDVLASKMLFSKQTIDMQHKDAGGNYDVIDAVNQMMMNITGYIVPDPMLPGALKSPSPASMEQLLTRRKYVAQMDAVGSLLYSIVSERSPGPQANEIYDLRTKQMGVATTDASQTPSQREIRQSTVEQLWDPNYYKNLYDNPSTIAQKELYLKAYSLQMLYDLISKQEKISNVYAIETANILSQRHKELTSAVENQPFK